MSDEEMWFEDEWLEIEPFHTNVVQATARMIEQMGQEDDPHGIKTTGDMMYHFTSHWYHLIKKEEGALIEPAIKACHRFVLHLIEVHGMPEHHQIAALQILIRFCALVITRSGGKLL